MKRMSIPGVVVALSLVLLLPLELAHCVWMGVPRAASAGGVPAVAQHACCRAAAASRSAPPATSPSAPRTCTCIQLPVVTLPSPPAVEAAPLVAVTFVVPVAVSLPAPTAPRSATIARAQISESPPDRAELSAHGLRAPPIPA